MSIKYSIILFLVSFAKSNQEFARITMPLYTKSFSSS